MWERDERQRKRLRTNGHPPQVKHPKPFKVLSYCELTTLTRGELEQHYASATAQEDELTAEIDAEVARRAAEVQPPPEAGRCMLC